MIETYPPLSEAQMTALRRRQPTLFGEATVHGHGMTMRALRKRKIVSGKMPFAYLTPEGRELCERFGL